MVPCIVHCEHIYIYIYSTHGQCIPSVCTNIAASHFGSDNNIDVESYVRIEATGRHNLCACVRLFAMYTMCVCVCLVCNIVVPAVLHLVFRTIREFMGNTIYSVCVHF